jgi:hypothetical protein
LVSSVDRLRTTVDTARTRYTRLVLVVGTTGSGKSALLRRLGETLGAPVVNLGLELSRALIDTPVRRRPVSAADRAADIVRGTGESEACLLDNIEAMFLPEMRLDPLKLLQDCARNRVVIAAWPGVKLGAALLFAQPSHPEFRKYETPDCEVIEIETLSRGSA